MSDLNTSLQFAQTPLPSDLPFYNYGSSAIAAGLAVSIDSTNVLDATVGNDGVGVVVSPTSGNPTFIGVTMETINGTNYTGGASAGRVRTQGVAACTADGSITAGTGVGPSSSTAGHVMVASAGEPYLGQALTTAVNGDPILVLIQPGFYY